jgi:hypothetical protein
VNDTLRNKCESCGMPEQLIGLPCAFCSYEVTAPVGMLAADGAVIVKEIIGWKGLDVRMVAGKARLQSPMFGIDGPWNPGEWKVARCFKGRTAAVAGTPTGHYPEQTDIECVPPVKNCQGAAHGCGYYAGRTREHLMQMGYQRYDELEPTVLVEVQLAGKMYPASNGWRAQKIRPVRIHVPHELWKVGAALEAEYGPHGVEIVLGTTIILPKEDTPEWCPKCTAKWQGRGVSCDFCGHTLNG